MQTETCSLQGIQCLTMFRADDARGSFVKSYQESNLKRSGIEFVPRESFYSISAKGVLRGMHFHHPPKAHAKLVYCPQGSILDVVLDLRKDQPTYGQYASFELSADNHRALYIPQGFAHGFLSLAEHSITVYLVDGEYDAKADDGVLFSSFGFDWPDDDYRVSERDSGFKPFPEFNSPF